MVEGNCKTALLFAYPFFFLLTHCEELRLKNITRKNRQGFLIYFLANKCEVKLIDFRRNEMENGTKASTASSRYVSMNLHSETE
jgi:hypothetical protein